MIAGVAVVLAAVSAIGWGVASAREDTLTGRAVSRELMAAIEAASHSCPMLTPARIAGTLMAESGLNNRATKTASGGRGIAGLDSEEWEKWKPWPDARRSDISANILAMAHQVCDFSGRLRAAGIPGDQWRLSVAAFHTGLAEVTKTKGVPARAIGYVDMVSGYAAYYGKLKQFGGTGGTGPTDPPAQEAKGIPAEYVPLIVRAGSVCETVTPPAIAAQLMALSGFDPNMLGAAGQRGIAQFRTEVWREYGPDRGSAWDPQVAVPAVGTAMCGLAKELATLNGDPYVLALAAYRNGPTAVRQAGGALDDETEAFLLEVKELTDVYALDGRLGTATPSASPSAPSPSATPRPPSTTPTTRPADPPSGDEEPPPSRPSRPTGAKQIFHPLTGLCVSSGSGSDGTRLTLQGCAEEPSQWWEVRTDGTIRSQGLCMDVAWAASEDGTAIQVANCSGNKAQSWRFNDNGGIISDLNNKSVDVDMLGAGRPLNLWYYVANAEQTWTLR